MDNFSHPIAVLKENLAFEKSKLLSEQKVWEVEMRLRIEQKIAELEKSIKLLTDHRE